MSASRRIVPAILLTTAVAAAGCGGSSPATGPSPSPVVSVSPSAAASPYGTGSGLVLAAIVDCLRGKGVPLPPGAKASQIKDAFLAMPKTQRRQAYQACAYLLPPTIRQEIEQRIKEATTDPTISP
jgi:hypothetical protein